MWVWSICDICHPSVTWEIRANLVSYSSLMLPAEAALQVKEDNLLKYEDHFFMDAVQYWHITNSKRTILFTVVN